MLASIIRSFRANPAIVGIAAGGSFAGGALDAYSDLDLIVVVEQAHWPQMLEDRSALAASCGPLLAAFTGEHVGEPRLLICLYGPPLVHVDLKFLRPEDLGARVEDPVLLWDRSGIVGSRLASGTARYPGPRLQWIEDRFWVWVHYAASKLARGELFELLTFLGFLRAQVLGPLALQQGGAQPNGVRKLEQYVPQAARELKATVARYDRDDVARALDATIQLYRALRGGVSGEGEAVIVREEAERAAVTFFGDVVERFKTES